MQKLEEDCVYPLVEECQGFKALGYESDSFNALNSSKQAHIFAGDATQVAANLQSDRQPAIWVK
ncbi:MAG: hypothetical protein ACRKGH_07680 [Dehalogenimonas sp.]